MSELIKGKVMSKRTFMSVGDIHYTVNGERKHKRTNVERTVIAIQCKPYVERTIKDLSKDDSISISFMINKGDNCYNEVAALEPGMCVGILARSVTESRGYTNVDIERMSVEAPYYLTEAEYVCPEITHIVPKYYEDDDNEEAVE